MGRHGWKLLIVLAVIVALVVGTVVFWPWLSWWLPHPLLIEAWLGYLVVDLNIGRWGPVATLLLVGVIELVWALNLGRRSGAFERQWTRIDRLHAREIEVLAQEVALLKEEQRALLAELELRDGLISEEKARLWARFENLQQASGLFSRQAGSVREVGAAALPAKTVALDAPELPPEVKGEWLQIISQLERIETVSSVTVRKGQSVLQLQKHADELLRLGSACYYLAQYERALIHYNRAIELAPNHPDVLINRAVVNQVLGFHQPALHDLEQALQVSENPGAYLHRGFVRERLGERKRALEDYSRAIRLDADFAEAHFRRGLLYAKLGEQDKAFQDQNQVLELDRYHAGALTARGTARAALGDVRWALSDLDKGCALAPSRYEAFYHRGCVRRQFEMYDEALADFGRAIELAPEVAAVFMARGDTYTDLDEHWQATTDYGRAIELEPKNPAAYCARGLARAATREYRRAIEDYDRALELDPALAVVMANRGAACEKLGEYEQAVEDLDRAIALDPNLAIAYYNRGLAYGNKGEYDRASRDLNKAVELDPSLGNIKDRAPGAEPA
jgi:tetratricopeptide (TPR) repeat protein